MTHNSFQSVGKPRSPEKQNANFYSGGKPDTLRYLPSSIWWREAARRGAPGRTCLRRCFAAYAALHVRAYSPTTIARLCSSRAVLASILALILTTLYLLSPASALALRDRPTQDGRKVTSLHIPTGVMNRSSAHGLILHINAGFDQRYRNGDWIPIHITLRNYGADFSGILSTSNPLGPVMQAAGFTSVPVSTYQQPITVRHGTQQQITMYLPLYTFFGPVNIPVQLLDLHGNLLLSQSASLSALNDEDVFVGLLTDQIPPGFSPLQALALPSQNGSVKLQFLNARTLPDIAKVLNNFNLIVLDDFSTKRLSHQQLRALGTWINQGGALIEIGGPQWQRTLASLPATLLPVSIYGTSTIRTGVTSPPFAMGLGLPLDSRMGVMERSLRSAFQNPAPTITVSNATVHTGARTILSADGLPLLVQTQHGQGDISFLAFDPTIPPILGWPGSTTLWKALLFRSLGEHIVPFDDGPSPSIDIAYGLAKLQHALLPYTSPTPWTLVLVFLAYLLILGPARWLIIHSLKRMDRTDERLKGAAQAMPPSSEAKGPLTRPYRSSASWRIALSTILIFSFFNYGLALYQQGTSMFSNSLSIITIDTHGSFAHSTSYVGIYVPFLSANANVQLHFPTGLLVQPFTDFVLDQQPATIITSSDGTNIHLPSVDLRALNAFQLEQDLPIHESIISHLMLSQDGHKVTSLRGTVTNTLHTSLSDAYLLLPNNILRLGTIGPAQTIHVALALPRYSAGFSMMERSLRSAFQIPSPTDVTSPPSPQGLPTCASLMNQLATSSGGLPAEYNQLFYHDITRSLSERQRHLSFLTYLLNSMQCNLSPSTDMMNHTPTLIAWADQPLDAVTTLTLNGIHPPGIHETLLLAPLDLSYAPGSLALPTNGLLPQLVDAQAVNIRRLSTMSYALMKGQMTFEYNLPPLPHLQRLTLTQPADTSTQSYPGPGVSLKNPAHLALYNWHTASWNAISLTASAPFSTSNVAAYLGPGEQVLLQCVNEEPDLGIIAFTKPILTASSN